MTNAAPTVSTRDPLAPRRANVRRRRIGKFPYAIVFAEGPEEYVVIAVQHYVGSQVTGSRG